MARTSTPLRPKARIPRRDDGASREVVLRLLAGFGVEVGGEEVSLPGSAQRVVAFVVLKSRETGDGEATAERLKAHASGLLPPFKRPAEIRLADALPRTATGKLQRFKLRDELANA